VKRGQQQRQWLEFGSMLNERSRQNTVQSAQWGGMEIYENDFYEYIISVILLASFTWVLLFTFIFMPGKETCTVMNCEAV